MSAGTWPYRLIFDGDPSIYEVWFDFEQLPKTTNTPNARAEGAPLLVGPDGAPNAGVLYRGPMHFYRNGDRLYVCVNEDGSYQ